MPLEARMASRYGRPESGTEQRPTTMTRPRTFLDTFLLGLWVFSYAGLIRVFGVLKRMESARGRRPESPNSAVEEKAPRHRFHP